MNSNNQTVIPHPASANSQHDKLRDRENLARQLRSTQMAREMAREQINPTEIIQRILETQIKLMGEEDAAGNPIPLDPAITKQLVAISNIDFKLLNKVVPDLKASESVSYSAHDHNHQHVHAKVDDLELIARIRLSMKNHNQTLRSPPAPSPPLAPEGHSEEAVYDFL